MKIHQIKYHILKKTNKLTKKRESINKTAVENGKKRENIIVQ